MKKKLIFYTVALTAGLLTACSSDDDVQESETPIRHISVEVNEQPMTSADDEAEARSMSTRSAITTTETFSEFNMRGVYGDGTSNYTVSKSGGTWTVSPNTWPSGAANDALIPFYAFTDGTFVKEATPYISFTIAENASTQHDLLVATNTVSFNDHQGKVPLTFDHACAAVAFNVKITSTLKSGKLGNSSLTVNSIVLRNVQNRGRYNFGTSSWSDLDGSAYYTLTSGNMSVDTDFVPLSSNYLFVIPQSRDANGTTGTYLEINYTFTGQKQTSATIPLAVNWEAGVPYTINIKLGTTLIQ